MKRFFCLFLFLGILWQAVLPTPFVFAETLVEKADDLEGQLQAKKQEIERLLQAIEQYRVDIQKEQTKAKTLGATIAILTNQVKKINLEIQALAAALEETRLQIVDKRRTITTTEGKIVQERDYLKAQVQLLQQMERDRWMLLFRSLRHGGLVDFFSTIGTLVTLQEKTKERLDTIKGLKVELEQQKAQLEEQREEQAELLRLQQIQRDEARRKEQEQATLLQQTKKNEKKLKSLIELSKESVDHLKNEIYALQKIGVTVQDAVKFGQLVAERTGIRAAFLIAVLEVESRLGLNVGKGTWKKDMNPNQRDAFIQVTKELGLDPNATPVSKKPSYGWGGAMGPAQFLPKTWLGYKDDVARLTGHNPPSPWNIEDAFMASGIKLANDGARSKTRAGELRATKAYLSGNPVCTKSICNFYSNAVLDKAADIERILEK